MANHPKEFKRPPKKYQPRGLTILYEDRDILVVDKSSGLLTVSTGRIRENTAYFLLNEYVRKGNSKSRHRVWIVHRLDKDTSGVLVFAKTEAHQTYLQETWREFTKKYAAIVHGAMPKAKGEISSYLTENSAFKVYSTKDPEKGKYAKTGYSVLDQANGFSLLEVNLYTGRKNQIRVHLADVGCPIVGDKKYGKKKEKGIKRLALHSSSLTLLHPFTKKEMTFHAKVPSYFKTLLNRRDETRQSTSFPPVS